jgi:hypothetical protein
MKRKVSGNKEFSNNLSYQLFVEESEHLEVSQKLRFRLFKELLCLLLLG